MLYLTRKLDEEIVINGDIRVRVVAVKGKQVKLGFEFPDNAQVLRGEVFEKIRAQNEEALASSADMSDFLK